MTFINSYLRFNGNCREAMTFYKKCLGGQLTFQTIGQSPLSEKLPKPMKQCILHASLVKNEFSIMATDMVPAHGLSKGNAVSLCIKCSEKDIYKFYTKLSEGGVKEYEIQETFWGSLFGELQDRFGNYWLLTSEKI